MIFDNVFLLMPSKLQSDDGVFQLRNGNRSLTHKQYVPVRRRLVSYINPLAPPTTTTTKPTLSNPLPSTRAKTTIASSGPPPSSGNPPPSGKPSNTPPPPPHKKGSGPPPKNPAPSPPSPPPPPPPPPLGYVPGPPLGRGPPLVQCAQCGILKPVAQYAREGGGVWEEKCASCRGMILDTDTGVTRCKTAMERDY
ncbi:hypothetical protein Q7P36_004805 [Cladosporium allicinum]